MKTSSKNYSFAFLVHSRDHRDIYRKYPQLKMLPKNILLFVLKHMRPILISRVTGLKDNEDQEVGGWVIGIPMTADQMMRHRDLALQRIRQAIFLAYKKGVTIVGLGGLTSSLSGGGTKLLDLPVTLTTGHAYTAFNVTKNLFVLAEMFDLPKDKVRVAIVGAAGSVGSMSALLSARANFTHIRLIDISRKNQNLLILQEEILRMKPEVQVEISHEIKDIRDCDFIITATNTPEALIIPDLVRDGQVIIDDAQPSDIHRDVLKMPNVLVVEAGVVSTPRIHSNFNFGLKHKTDNFCCMAELLILASKRRREHYVINRATLDQVDEISNQGEELQFTLASFQNFLESISSDKIEQVKFLARKYHGL